MVGDTTFGSNDLSWAIGAPGSCGEYFCDLDGNEFCVYHNHTGD